MRWHILPKDFKRHGDQNDNKYSEVIPRYRLPPKALACFFLAYSVHRSLKLGVTALSLLTLQSGVIFNSTAVSGPSRQHAYSAVEIFPRLLYRRRSGFLIETTSPSNYQICLVYSN